MVRSVAVTVSHSAFSAGLTVTHLYRCHRSVSDQRVWSMASSLVIRVRTPDGRPHSITLSSADTVQSMQAKVADATGISTVQQELLSGFPPRPITAKRTDSLETAGITNGSALTLRELSVTPLAIAAMPDDNSCLFHAVAFGLEGNNVRVTASELRTAAVVQLQDASVDLASPLNPFLASIDDLPRYFTVMSSSGWGGGLECAALSLLHRVEILAVDVETGTLFSFNVGATSKRIVLMYSGIHYDALYDATTDVRLFDASSPLIEARARLTAEKVRDSGRYTNIATFTLRCSVCDTKIRGEKDANEHARSSGHTAFEEYR